MEAYLLRDKELGYAVTYRECYAHKDCAVLHIQKDRHDICSKVYGDEHL